MLGVVMRMGVMAIAISGVFTSICSTFINSYPNKRLLNYSYFEQILDVFPSFILSVIMLVCVYPLSILQINQVVILILQIVLGVIIYVGLAKLTGNKNLGYMVLTFKNIVGK